VVVLVEVVDPIRLHGSDVELVCGSRGVWMAGGREREKARLDGGRGSGTQLLIIEMTRNIGGGFGFGFGIGFQFNTVAFHVLCLHKICLLMLPVVSIC
jgi:hypothetical protein